MNGYKPTDVAIGLAAMQRDQEFIKADIADDAVNDKIFRFECAENGTTVEKAEMARSDFEKREYRNTIERIPVDPNSDHESLMRILQSNKSEMTIDEAMGLEPWDDDVILEELLDLDET